MLDSTLRFIRRFIPKKIFRAAQPAYHFSLAFLGAFVYGFPSRRLRVVGVTGTKGKTSTVEMVHAILERAGKRTALAGTLRFKIGGESTPNTYKMTMPGRFFIQRFLRRAVRAGCEYAVIEMSSEAAVQYRHRFIDLDALIFTNLAPEHIESHGSYENYVAAKLSIAAALARSPKKNRAIVANADDAEGSKFLAAAVERKIPYSMRDVSDAACSADGTAFTYAGVRFSSPLPGAFTIMNMLAAVKYAASEGVPLETCRAALADLAEIKGRAERIIASPRQAFIVIVDYAHTPESLRAIYEAFPGKRIIGVLGATGGGRDVWKRAKMADVAERHCAEIILTDEDPYDDDPRAIVDDLARHFTAKKPAIIMDRRAAIRQAIRQAAAGDAVIITGKGTDPYIMRANGRKEPWSDAAVAREELEKVFA